MNKRLAMSDQERAVKVVSFSALIAIVGLLIIMINVHSLFPEFVFYSTVLVLVSVIVVLVVYAFLWYRASRYVTMRLWRRKQNILARKHFEDFKDFVERFTSLSEFRNVSQGINGVLEGLLKHSLLASGDLINTRINAFGLILRDPINNFKQRLDALHWNKRDVNREFLSSLAKEFENYVGLHKQLYVDFAVIMAREIGLDKIAQTIKSNYSNYKDDYNQFVIAYTDFAKKTSKELGIFSQSLPKAFEL